MKFNFNTYFNNVFKYLQLHILHPLKFYFLQNKTLNKIFLNRSLIGIWAILDDLSCRYWLFICQTSTIKSIVIAFFILWVNLLLLNNLFIFYYISSFFLFFIPTCTRVFIFFNIAKFVSGEKNVNLFVGKQRFEIKSFLLGKKTLFYQKRFFWEEAGGFVKHVGPKVFFALVGLKLGENICKETFETYRTHQNNITQRHISDNQLTMEVIKARAAGVSQSEIEEIFKKR